MVMCTKIFPSLYVPHNVIISLSSKTSMRVGLHISFVLKSSLIPQPRLTLNSWQSSLLSLEGGRDYRCEPPFQAHSFSYIRNSCTNSRLAYSFCVMSCAKQQKYKCEDYKSQLTIMILRELWDFRRNLLSVGLGCDALELFIYELHFEE